MRISDWSSDVCSSYLHLFDAADSTFAIALTGQETIELRRWVIGPEGSSRGRRRGLAARLSDVASYDEEGARAIEAARNAALALPSDDWLKRINTGEPFGPVEAMLAAARGTVYARDAQDGAAAGYGLETDMAELDGALVEDAQTAAEALENLLRQLTRLRSEERRVGIEWVSEVEYRGTTDP